MGTDIVAKTAAKPAAKTATKSAAKTTAQKAAEPAKAAEKETKPAAKPAAKKAETKPAAKKAEPKTTAKKAESKPAAKAAKTAESGKVVKVGAASAAKEEKIPAGSIKIRLAHGFSGRLDKHIATAKSLGLRKIGDVTVQPDNAATRGKVAQICHMVEIVKTK